MPAIILTYNKSIYINISIFK